MPIYPFLCNYYFDVDKTKDVYDLFLLQNLWEEFKIGNCLILLGRSEVVFQLLLFVVQHYQCFSFMCVKLFQIGKY